MGRALTLGILQRLDKWTYVGLEDIRGTLCRTVHAYCAVGLSDTASLVKLALALGGCARRLCKAAGSGLAVGHRARVLLPTRGSTPATSAGFHARRFSAAGTAALLLLA